MKNRVDILRKTETSRRGRKYTILIIDLNSDCVCAAGAVCIRDEFSWIRLMLFMHNNTKCKWYSLRSAMHWQQLHGHGVGGSKLFLKFAGLPWDVVNCSFAIFNFLFRFHSCVGGCVWMLTAVLSATNVCNSNSVLHLNVDWMAIERQTWHRWWVLNIRLDAISHFSSFLQFLNLQFVSNHNNHIIERWRTNKFGLRANISS